MVIQIRSDTLIEKDLEGPPLRVIAEELAQLKGKYILKVSGNSKIQQERLQEQKDLDVFSWGKNLFLQFPEFSLKIHFLMFGSYRFNEERKGVVPRLSLAFSQDTLNLYNCSVKILSNSDVENLYDEELDIMSEKWNLTKIISLVSNLSEAYICDVLLDQNVFAGVGNIIKNEALFMSEVHPLSIVEKIPKKKLEGVASAARKFSLIFHRTAKNGESIRSHLTIYGKKKCPICGEKVAFQKTGKTKRISYFCPSSQILYA
jgi:endonuclease-8